ncbi:MAG: hypothetical protein ACE5I3_01285 [Phycisphaerae bacterium]
MKRSQKTLWCKLVIGALTLPLLQTSCVEILQRAVINGFFDAATPLLDEEFEERLGDVFATSEDP